MKNLKQVRGEDLFLDARHDKLKFKEKVCSTGNETSLCKKKQKRNASHHLTTQRVNKSTTKKNITKKHTHTRPSRQILTN